MLVGLAGYKRSGKDTVANCLVERYRYKKFAFADKLRDEAEKINPFILSAGMDLRSLLNRSGGWEKVKYVRGYETREILRGLGAAMRSANKNVFVEEMEARLASEFPGAFDSATPVRAVVSDVRMPNELSMIRRLGGVLVQVTRDGAEFDGHETEAGFSEREYDAVLANDGSVVDLYRAVDRLMADLKVVP